MLDYLKKFNNLPQELKDKISAPEMMAAINDLEKKYSVNLAAPIMKVMVGDLMLEKISLYFSAENKLKPETCESLANELKQAIFSKIGNFSTAKREEKYPSAAKNNVQSGASFFFSPEDEEEIKILAEKIGPVNGNEFSGDVETILNNIIFKADINFGNEYLLNRFKDIIRTYLKGVRDKIDTKQALLKPFDGGGLAFDEESANKIITLAENTKKQPVLNLAPVPKMMLPEEKAAKNGGQKNLPRLRDVDYDLASLVKKGKTGEGQAEKKIPEVKYQKLDYKHELPSPLPAIVPNPIPNKIKKQEKETNNPVRPATRNAQILKRVEEPAGRKKIEDVKFVPRIMNPIDELRYMDLVSFRRLGRDAQTQAERIKEKISLLEDEQYGKRIEGIRGWRQSPVNRLYITMGQESINENLAINDIIKKRQVSKRDYLTNEEIEAIVDLNKSLRF